MNFSIDTLKELGVARTEPTKPRNKLGQEEFLKLMTTQLTHQDPSKPLESGEFLGQLAQFSTVTGIQDLQKSFGEFARSVNSDQALQAANLVGRTVLAPGDEGLLAAGGSLGGEVIVPDNATSVAVEILDSNGGLVKRIDLGSQLPGQTVFSWDGLDSDGTLASPGAYKIRANAVIDGTNTALVSLVQSRVDSVTLGKGNGGLTINVAGLGAINFSDIQQIL